MPNRTDNDPELVKLRQILQDNADKSFVQRIVNYMGPQNSPVLDLGNGELATHRMAWNEAGGRYFAYPTVLMGQDGKLKDYGDSAWDHVVKTGNYIEFQSPQEADWFSKNYKRIWPEQFR